jgi:hypothetical protein
MLSRLYRKVKTFRSDLLTTKKYHLTLLAQNLPSYSREQATTVPSRQAWLVQQGMGFYLLEGAQGCILVTPWTSQPSKLRPPRAFTAGSTLAARSPRYPNTVNAHKCPQCLQPNETQEHILKCPHTGAHS